MLIKRKTNINKLQNYNISLSSELRKQNKSNDLFEVMIANLTLEELIALKLEITYKNFDKPIYGYRLFRYIHYIVKDAMLKFTLAITSSNAQAIKFLGIDKKDYKVLLKKYSTREYYMPKEKGDVDNGNTIKENI